MQTIMGSSAVRPLVGTVSARRSKVAAARVGAARGDRLAVVRSATLRVARTADDLGAAGSMTASGRVLRSRVAAVMPTTGRSRRCVSQYLRILHGTSPYRVRRRRTAPALGHR